MWFPPFYKTVNNINIVFSNYFQKRYKFANLFTFNDIGLKSDIFCTFKENSFSKDFGTGTSNVKSCFDPLATASSSTPP